MSVKGKKQIVIFKTIFLTSVVNLSADDPSVAIFANKIANSTVTCNGTEVQQLVVLEVQVTELAADITIQFTAVQVVIQGKIELVD